MYKPDNIATNLLNLNIMQNIEIMLAPIDLWRHYQFCLDFCIDLAWLVIITHYGHGEIINYFFLNSNKFTEKCDGAVNRTH